MNTHACGTHHSPNYADTLKTPPGGTPLGTVTTTIFPVLGCCTRIGWPGSTPAGRLTPKVNGSGGADAYTYDGADS